MSGVVRCVFSCYRGVDSERYVSLHFVPPKIGLWIRFGGAFPSLQTLRHK